MTLDLDGIEARAALATPGPWMPLQPDPEGGYGWWVWQAEKLPYYGGVFNNDHIYEHIAGKYVPGAVGEALIKDCEPDEGQELADAEFIAHARTDVPALVAEVRRLYAVINRVRDAVNEHRSDSGADATVPAGAIFAAIYLSDRPITDRDIRRAHEIEALINAEEAT